jgi:import receptor subunit TOM20
VIFRLCACIAFADLIPNQEFPVVAALDADLESSGKYCSHCFRELQKSDSSVIHSPEDANSLGSSYCSEECFKTSKAQSTSLLFSLESPLPPELPTVEDIDKGARKNAQAKFVGYVQKEKRAGPLLIARFIARQVAVETAKLAKKEPPEKNNDFTTADGGDYMLVDHMERLRLLEVEPTEEELPLIADVLQKTLPGLEQFVTKERYATLVGKMLYNAIGVGSRDDKVGNSCLDRDQMHD